MVGSLIFELLKLRKRPAVLVLSAILLALTVLFGYVLQYQFVLDQRAMVDQRDPGPGAATVAKTILHSILPENVLSNVLHDFSDLGGPVALILGVLTVGSEYGWATLKTILSQRPGRSEVFLGKAFALGIVFAVLTLLIFAAGASASYVIALNERASVAWPSILDWMSALGAAWLSLAAWGAVGMFLATLLRGASLAIGLGLVYVLLIENMIVGLAGTNEALGWSISDVLLGSSTQALATSFEESASMTSAQPLLVLTAYLMIPLLFAILLFSYRDVAR